MRVFRFLLKRWRRWLWQGEELSAKIDVRKWSEQIESLNRTSSK